MTAWPVALELVRELVTVTFCILASGFAIAGTFGLIRFPDAYTRLQAASLTGTTAVFSVFIAALVIAPELAVAARVIVVILFFLVSNPTTTHIISRFAWKSGIDPWTRPTTMRRSRRPSFFRVKDAGDVSRR